MDEAPTAVGTDASAEATAQRLTRALAPIGRVWHTPRLGGFALLEDGVMFGFVDENAVPYLRTSTATAARFRAMGSRKHPELPYWSIPELQTVSSSVLCELAYEAADVAHIAYSFGFDDGEWVSPAQSNTALRIATLVLAAA